MATYLIEFVAWQMLSHFRDLLPIFRVYQGHERHLLFLVSARLGYYSARSLRERLHCSEEHVKQALQCYVEWQIERRLRDGTLPTSPKTETQWVPVKEIDLLAILLMGKLYHEEVEGACKHEPPGAQILEP